MRGVAGVVTLAMGINLLVMSVVSVIVDPTLYGWPIYAVAIPIGSALVAIGLHR